MNSTYLLYYTYIVRINHGHESACILYTVVVINLSGNIYCYCYYTHCTNGVLSTNDSQVHIILYTHTIQRYNIIRIVVCMCVRACVRACESSDRSVGISAKGSSCTATAGTAGRISCLQPQTTWKEVFYVSETAHIMIL